MKGNPVLYKTLVVGVIVLFVGVGIQPAIANDIAIFDEKSKKYENNSKIKNFWDIILFLLDLFEKILNKFFETIISLISAIVFIILILFLG